MFLIKLVFGPFYRVGWEAGKIFLKESYVNFTLGKGGLGKRVSKTRQNVFWTVFGFWFVLCFCVVFLVRFVGLCVVLRLCCVDLVCSVAFRS